MEFSEYLQWDRVAPFLRHPVHVYRIVSYILHYVTLFCISLRNLTLHYDVSDTWLWRITGVTAPKLPFCTNKFILKIFVVLFATDLLQNVTKLGTNQKKFLAALFCIYRHTQNGGTTRNCDG